VYLSDHQRAQAASEFQKIVDHRMTVVSNPIGALVHLQLARAFVQTGDRANARRAYEDFLSLWKDANAHIPMAEARADYAVLVR